MKNALQHLPSTQAAERCYSPHPPSCHRLGALPRTLKQKWDLVPESPVKNIWILLRFTLQVWNSWWNKAMFISSEWTKKENLCVDTIIFLDSRGKNARLFFYFFFFLLYFFFPFLPGWIKPWSKSSKGRTQGPKLTQEFSFKNAPNTTLGGCDLQKLGPTINHPGNNGCRRPTLGVGPVKWSREEHSRMWQGTHKHTSSPHIQRHPTSHLPLHSSDYYTRSSW